jgi:hypothetical protein
MPINNELITEILNKLELKRSELNNEERKLGGYIHTISSIKSQNDDTMPLDGLTDEPMSKERRDEIFNSVVKRAQKYLGGNK